MPDKRNSNETPPQPGELVLMINPDQKRSSWRTAVLEQTIPGTDGQIRSVQIRAGNRARMIRPITQLASLKLIMDLPEDLPPLTDDQTAVVVQDEGGEIELTQ